jgi:beta-galactosidase
VDDNDRVRLGGYPAPLREALGLTIEEFAPLMEGETQTIFTDDIKFSGSFWSEVIHAQGAEVLARFGDGYLANSPAITRHTYGRGVAYYLATELESYGLSWLLDRVLADAEIPSRPSPRGVELVERHDATHRWLFALNHAEAEAEVPLEGGGVDVLRRLQVQGHLHLAARDVAIVRLD